MPKSVCNKWANQGFLHNLMIYNEFDFSIPMKTVADMPLCHTIPRGSKFATCQFDRCSQIPPKLSVSNDERQ